jgi:hypothetical protein
MWSGLAGCAGDNLPRGIDHDGEGTGFVEEGQPPTPGVPTDAALAQARDLSGTHERLNLCNLYPESRCDQCRVDGESVLVQLDSNQWPSPIKLASRP